MNSEDLTTESTVYVVYIAATAERVWDVLTSAELSPQYFFGHRVQSDWKLGSPWTLFRPDSSVGVTGEVRETDRPRRLLLSWQVEGPTPAGPLPECQVSYDIEPVSATAVRLTMTEAHPTPIPAELLKGGRRGWPMILSGLKTLLETGRPLDLAMPSLPQQPD